MEPLDFISDFLISMIFSISLRSVHKSWHRVGVQSARYAVFWGTRFKVHRKEEHSCIHSCTFMLNLLTSLGSMVSLGPFPIAICFFLGADYRHGLDHIPFPSFS